MEQFSPSEMKTILHSKRANMYYLEYCRVLVKDGRVEYVTDEGKQSCYWNIPIANTTTLLLGNGTSITQAAVRELAKAGVLIGFCGGGGAPLFSTNEVDVDVSFFSPQSEYRPVGYLQNWVSFWFDKSKRLQAAKLIQQHRIKFTRAQWLKNKQLKEAKFTVDPDALNQALVQFEQQVQSSKDTQALMLSEARLTKNLYKIICSVTGYNDFSRVKQGAGTDFANHFLDHGNYLAYGLGATATWVLGLPHGLSVLHGKTRRGGLVFDAADLVKDGVVLPQAFLSAMNGDSEQEFRQACIAAVRQSEALDFMIDSLKAISDKCSA
ncbi:MULTISPECIES: type I-F CRISPR-associated endonuclease Cas1f [Salinimonas]|uniref:Type I-F CRISPR-associated endonuclease Cas1 n=2 Tax=Salinimonas TaxID=288793 RepID=A0A5B7YIB3_9ALTE|nr:MULTISPECIES: type I-F CRISPR-associated endonuclease Cas1f [Salinimonas]MBD3587535.1 type I-F CRISPR-associated endonuclease Cas1 [Salinimonas profundi]QCZ95552.1 type I-F CRISPR-associated endonuclease Cas1 [Salinimonas iocasae]